MASRTAILFASACAIASGAGADYVGITAEIDPFALDGVTPLTSLPEYGEELVVNVYARFNQVDDQALGVIGTPDFPFQIQTFSQSGFVNVGAGLDTPPPASAVSFFPQLNWDSFVTIGLKITNPGDALIVAPGTPGPNTDPWPDVPRTNMAWLVPPAIDGVPPPQSVAGSERRVLLMRLSLGPDEILVGGSFGVLVRSNDKSVEMAGTFTACCDFDVCGTGLDCNDNGVSDACDVVRGTSGDVNANGRPDECECLADVAPQPIPDGLVNVQDIVEVIVQWNGPGTADVNADGNVDVQDLVLIIQAWGVCS